MALIFCSECGAQISDKATACPRCGAPVANPAPTPAPEVVSSPAPAPAPASSPNAVKVCPETHLAKAIVVTIICCWPFGIPAIVNAAAVSNEFAAGNYELALQKSANAAKWSKYAIIAGAIFWVLYIVIIVVAAVIGY